MRRPEADTLKKGVICVEDCNGGGCPLAAERCAVYAAHLYHLLRPCLYRLPVNRRSELVQLKLNIGTSVEDFTPTEAGTKVVPTGTHHKPRPVNKKPPLTEVEGLEI